MIQLQDITNIALIIFVSFYVVGTFWKPLIIRKKSLLKKMLSKWRINVISMEFDQSMLKIERENAGQDLKDLQKQILDLKGLKEEKEKELKEIKADKKKTFQEAEAKQKEITEIDEQAKKLLDEEASMDKTIKMAEGKIGQYTKELSMLERSLEIGKKLIKDL